MSAPKPRPYTAEEARKMAYRCSAHKAERDAAKGGE